MSTTRIVVGTAMTMVIGIEGDPNSDAFLDTVDALVMGRGTFDVVNGFAGGWPYPKPVYVWTSHPDDLRPQEDADVRPVSGSLDDVLGRLRADAINRVYVDGGATIRQWLDAGLVDRLTISKPKGRTDE